MSGAWRIRVRSIGAIALCVAAFVVFPACFLRDGTRAPKAAPPPPTRGPLVATGGQRLRAPVPADAAARAQAALVARGWTPVASSRADEALGVIHDNVAVIRWAPTGWWARVDQRSAFEAPHVRVPRWDHPWEALRLLHACAPGAGPAEGWAPWPAGAPFDLDRAARERRDPYTAFAVMTVGPSPHETSYPNRHMSALPATGRAVADGARADGGP